MITAIIKLNDGRIIRGTLSHLQYVNILNPEIWNYEFRRFDKMNVQNNVASFYYTDIQIVKAFKSKYIFQDNNPI